MANRIYINIIGTDYSFFAPCTEDIQVQAISQFTKIGDFVPAMDTLATLVNTASSGINGLTSSRMVALKNALDVPIWQRTEPVRIATDLNFFIKTNGYNDVWVPTMTLQSMNILSKQGDQLVTPGLNLKSIGNPGEVLKNSTSNLTNDLRKAFQSSINTKDNVPQSSDFTSTSKLCSIFIPSIVYVPVAIVENIQITWSKHLSTAGYPIWSKVNVQFTGVLPAIFEDNFLNSDINSTAFAGLL
jgi:hypothetical protein